MKTEAFQRATKTIIGDLSETATRIGRAKYHNGVDRTDALTQARAIKIAAAGVLAAAEAAIAEWGDPPPPANHYHETPRLSPQPNRPRALTPGSSAVAET